MKIYKVKTTPGNYCRTRYIVAIDKAHAIAKYYQIEKPLEFNNVKAEYLCLRDNVIIAGNIEDNEPFYELTSKTNPIKSYIIAPDKSIAILKYYKEFNLSRNEPDVIAERLCNRDDIIPTMEVRK